MKSQFRHVALIGKYHAAVSGRGRLHARRAGGHRALPGHRRAARWSSSTKPPATAGIAGYTTLDVRGHRRAMRPGAWWSAATAPCWASAGSWRSYGVPLIGINQGRLGFITDIPLDQLPQPR